MKKYRFLILTGLLVLVIAVGAVWKHTVLREIRMDPLYLYEIRYTVEVRDLEDYKLKAMQKREQLYLEDNTIMGEIQDVESVPAASGAEGCVDVVLTASAIGGKFVNSNALEYDLEENNTLKFINRYLTFEGTVTHVQEVDV